MYYKVLVPHPDLRPYIGCYWILKTEASYQAKKEVIIPDGYAEIILNLAAPYTWQLMASQACYTIRDTHIVGQRNTSVVVNLPPSLYQVGIKLKALAMPAFFNLPSSQVANQLVHGNDLPDKTFTTLAEQVYATSSAFVQKQVLDHFFLKKLHKQEPADTISQRAVARMVAQKGMLRMDELKNTLGIDYRTLERRFKTSVGLTPKEFARIIRFKNVYKAFRTYASTDNTFFLDWGYYDQSHFIKEFKSFMIHTPKAYQAGVSNLSDSILKKGFMETSASAYLCTDR